MALDLLIDRLLWRLKEGLKGLYGERLRGVYLFGSYARGEQDRESDVDVLIVLDRVDRYGAEVDLTGPLVSELSLAFGVSISRVFLSEGDWKEGQYPFAVRVREEAVPA